MEDIDISKSYPATKNAYDIALKSYDWAIQRSDAIDNRASKLLAWISSITIGVIAIMYSKTPLTTFQNNYFYTAMVVFAIAVILGAVIEFITYVRFISPQKLYEEYLHYEEEEFMRYIIYFAGQAFQKNLKLINRKGYILGTMLVLFLVELALLGIWITF